MEQQVHFVTVATADLDAARRFYVDGLDWSPTLDVPGEILFFQIGPGIMLGLFDAAQFTADLGPGDLGAAHLGAPADVTPRGFTLSHNVSSPQEVDRVLAAAAAAGAAIRKPGQPASFGGYHGHFADPNGLLWEIAHNPGWSVTPTGTVLLAPANPETSG
ncbi:VOC family protein [Micromonospora sp. NBC_01699]|uniref:VOC family protein n=1 Tax=Micromonospora sp. NBC_01699 TaxID=2975984 RepID=UPI002E3521FF|nr:VOC family protein [Micromonospora sp. NBC_01699]